MKYLLSTLLLAGATAAVSAQIVIDETVTGDNTTTVSVDAGDKLVVYVGGPEATNSSLGLSFNGTAMNPAVVSISSDNGGAGFAPETGIFWLDITSPVVDGDFTSTGTPIEALAIYELSNAAPGGPVNTLIGNNGGGDTPPDYVFSNVPTGNFVIGYYDEGDANIDGLAAPLVADIEATDFGGTGFSYVGAGTVATSTGDITFDALAGPADDENFDTRFVGAEFAVPEPSAFGAIAGALALGVIRRRR